eukprot:6367450-Pyramimonas_sp.AAC.1
MPMLVQSLTTSTYREAHLPLPLLLAQVQQTDVVVREERHALCAHLLHKSHCRRPPPACPAQPQQLEVHRRGTPHARPPRQPVRLQ